MSTSAPPADSRSDDSSALQRLVEEQAALRRVATLVAAGAPQAEVFEAVSAEVAALIGADGSALMRYEPNGTVTAVSSWTAEGGYTNLDTHYPREGTVSGLVYETGRPGRIDSYADATGEAPVTIRAMGIQSSVGAPITVAGRPWGALAVVSKSAQPLPGDTERRLSEFAELFATAISNSEANHALARLAEEQAALRRVATLVAQGAAPTEVFEAVAAEVGGLIPADAAGLARYETDGATAVASWTKADGYLAVGHHRKFSEGTVARLVFDTRQPGRVDSYEGMEGSAAATVRDWGWRSAVGAPVIVESRLWGVVLAASTTDRPLPPETEERLAQFTELVATAIGNTESRAELDASRARIVATADATRRRIERDLHDGAQQQLVWLALALRAAQTTVPEEFAQHRSELSRVIDGLTAALDDLREIALGIHPAGLSEDGLTPALKRLVSRSPLRVDLDVRADGRFPEPVEVTAYYVVSEALTNAAKYADVPVVDVAVAVAGGALRVEVRDEGRGGADPAGGSGLLGLKDRVEAIGGTMRLTSPPGGGTSVGVVLPLRGEAAHP